MYPLLSTLIVCINAAAIALTTVAVRVIACLKANGIVNELPYLITRDNRFEGAPTKALHATAEERKFLMGYHLILEGDIGFELTNDLKALAILTGARLITLQAAKRSMKCLVLCQGKVVVKEKNVQNEEGRSQKSYTRMCLCMYV